VEFGVGDGIARGRVSVVDTTKTRKLFYVGIETRLMPGGVALAPQGGSATRVKDSE
jgi:hypothetical protein